MYDLRLKASTDGKIVHINEYLYTEIDEDTRKSGERIFDYVDPKTVRLNRNGACMYTTLKDINAFLEPKFEQVAFDRRSLS